MKVAVVGGGLAGLAAALACADGGAEVVLYEGRSRLGGATFSFERDGLELDNGQHVALRCCTEYRGFLRRIGTDHLLPLQGRLRVPVLREGRPAASISRSGLRPPLHLASSLLRYEPLRFGERLAAARAATGLSKLDPSDPALDEQTFASWLRAHGQSQNAIDSLWNLIALPTLNLPAEDASLAVAAKVFRTGLLDDADASDIGVPAVPFRLLHAEPAAAAIEAAGGRVHDLRAGPLREPRPAAHPRRRSRRSRRRHPRRPTRSRRRRRPTGCRRRRGARRARHQPDREPPRPLRPARPRRAPRGRSRLPGAVDLRPHGGVGRARGPARRDLAVARGRRDRGVCRRASRPLPACTRAAASGREERDGARLRSHARAPGDVRRRPRHGEAPARAPNVGARRLPRRILDRHGLAGDDGERREKRPRSGTARRFGFPRNGRRSPRDGHGRPPDRRRGAEPRPRDQAPTRAAARGGLVEGRARDERHDRLRGSLPAPLPRPPRSPAGRCERGVDPEPPAARRVVGDLLRRARRPLDLGRGLRRAATRGRPSGRRAHAQRLGIRPGGGRRRRQPGLHADVAFAPRPLVVGRGADAASRADPPPGAGAALDLLLRLLGPSDDRGALDRDSAPPLAAGRVRDRRAARSRSAPRSSDGRLGPRFRSARPCVPRIRPPAVGHPTAPGTPHSRALGGRTPGARRLLGRDPAAVGLVDHRPARARLRARPPGDRARPRRARRLHDRRRARAARRGMSIAGLGYRTLGDRAPRRGDPRVRPGGGPRLRVARRPGRLDARRLGRTPAGARRPAASRSSSPTRTTPTSTTPRSSRSRSDAPGTTRPAP